ncbi:hypothetical protein [Mycoplasmopsis meleagridis]|uniref:hypothetical protein n=1 Tax=Mycoplasmopsis meleagridis TaxID=29561 RepID=UPI0007C440B5|nr:hypothetical protein [Mycoplasmopsis meleagridis]
MTRRKWAPSKKIQGSIFNDFSEIKTINEAKKEALRYKGLYDELNHRYEMQNEKIKDLEFSQSSHNKIANYTNEIINALDNKKKKEEQENKENKEIKE